MRYGSTGASASTSGSSSSASDQLPHCFSPSFRLPVPVPQEVACAGCQGGSFACQLAARGSADEVFWEQVFGSTTTTASVTATVTATAAGQTQAQEQAHAQALPGGESGSDVEAASVVQRYVDSNSSKYKDTSDLVAQHQACLRQNIFMYPKPLPSFSHLPASEALDLRGGDASGSCSGSVSSSDEGSRFDSFILRSRVLGKRGRLYDEVWDEGDFLEKKSALVERCNRSSHLVPFRTEAIGNWSQILNNFSDDHDGIYVDWLLDKAHAKCKQKKIDEIYNMRREEERIKLKIQEEEEVMSLFAPPVPVSCQHPASWGLHRRRRGSPALPTAIRDPSMGLDRGRKRRGGSSSGSGGGGGGEEGGDWPINAAEWHPAAHTSKTVLPVAYSTSPRSRTKHPRGGNTPKGEEEGVFPDDKDDLSLHLDALVTQLALQSATNFIHLSNLTSAVGNEMNLQSLRIQHQKLENASLHISKLFTKTDAEVRNAATEATMRQQIAMQQVCTDNKAETKTVIETETETEAKTAAVVSTSKKKTTKKKRGKREGEGEGGSKGKSKGGAVRASLSSPDPVALSPGVATASLLRSVRSLASADCRLFYYFIACYACLLGACSCLLNCISLFYRQPADVNTIAANGRDISGDEMTLKPKIFQNKNIFSFENNNIHVQPPQNSMLSHHRDKAFLSSLRSGCLVEVCSSVGDEGVWSLSTVVGVKTDTSGAVRLIQVYSST
jgi:hypothetical protein